MTAAPPVEFLSCDWGTSHFRLRWLANGALLRQHRDDNGCRRLFERGQQKPGVARAELFQNHLLSVLAQWAAVQPVTTSPIPLIVSGMASSSIGWLELPYAKAPLRFDGTQLRVEKLAWPKPEWIDESYLVSGVATETNMMRGEETEAIGLLASIGAPEDALLILPGTHSKHLRIRDGVLLDIHTYMTGELYEVLTRASILAASTDSKAGWDEANFLEGVAAARAPGMAESLFVTRTRHVLAGRLPAENASFLSGVLVGAEIHDALRRYPGTFLLVGGATQLRSVYSAALRTFPNVDWKCLPDSVCDFAVSRGHEVILSSLANESS